MHEDAIQPQRKSLLLDQLGGAIAGALIASATWALSGLGAPVWDAVLRVAPSQWLHRVLVLLLVVVVLLSLWVFRLRRLCREPSTRGLKFDDYGGFYVEQKTGLGVCTRCINDSPRRYVHLMDAGAGRMCTACSHTYRNRPKPKEVNA